MQNIKLEDITFVIVTYKSDRVLEDCLNSIPPEMKKVIVENSSNNKFKEDIEKKYSNLKCYLTGKNLGYGVANNYGVRKVDTDYVFILNPDVKIEKKNLDRIIKILNKENFDLAAPIDFNEKNIIEFKEINILEVNEVKGFAMIIKREFFLKYLFDENIFLYLEEIDLCRRIKKDNGKIILMNVSVNHHGGNSHGNVGDLEMEKSRNWHWMWSQFYFYKKYNGYLYGILKTLPNLFNCLLKFFLFKIFNKKKSIKYKMRFLRLINSYMLKKSFYRP